MIRNYISLVTLVAGAACLVVVLSATVASAAKVQTDGMRLSDANITVDVGDESSVTAVYRFTTGTGDVSQSYINGTVWRFQGQEISPVAVWVSGEPTEQNIDSERRHIRLGIPILSVTDRTVTVKLQYTVSGTGERGKVPLWVPSATHESMNPVVNTVTRLPNNTRKQGLTFPVTDRTTANGRVLHSRSAHVPAFVFVSHGQLEGNSAVEETLRSISYFIFRDRHLTGGGSVLLEQVMTLSGQLKAFIILSAGFVGTAALWIRYKNQQEPQNSETSGPDDTAQARQGEK
jgi:hypothetical protein